MTIKRIAWIAALLLFLAGPRALTADEINPPFGLRWGETGERMERLLRGAKATIVNRRMVEGREAWDVEGLVQAGLRRTVFYFHKGELVEVELQYQWEEWDESKYDGFMGDVRRKIQQRYGEGQLITNRTEKEAATDLKQKLIGYKWNHNNAAIELVYFAADNGSQVFRTVSLHYKTF